MLSLEEGGLWRCVSFNEMKRIQGEMREQQKLKIQIEEHHQMMQKDNINGFNEYFNFGLNTTTWRMFVNK